MKTHIVLYVTALLVIIRLEVTSADCNGRAARCLDEIEEISLRRNLGQNSEYCWASLSYVACLTPRTTCQFTTDYVNQEIARLNAELSQNKAGCYITESRALVTRSTNGASLAGPSDTTLAIFVLFLYTLVHMLLLK
ncbi:uncharacterized protein LOC131937039 [Physella acuta]|uniref:uncharacterized protein LOC131937039 n=1 Tax=Physella acuta TaxID=109671 RepID=UPI0027DCA40C|nr:uncharacterized protein LOC131937039 [Physella acuta]